MERERLAADESNLLVVKDLILLGLNQLKKIEGITEKCFRSKGMNGNIGGVILLMKP